LAFPDQRIRAFVPLSFASHLFPADQGHASDVAHRLNAIFDSIHMIRRSQFAVDCKVSVALIWPKLSLGKTEIWSFGSSGWREWIRERKKG
jgi:hypothetical protein